MYADTSSSGDAAMGAVGHDPRGYSTATPFAWHWRAPTLNTAGAPSVSVVMPFLNAERWIDQALASLLSQDFHDFELIAIDDGSTDSSAARVAGAAQRGLPITLLRNEANLGIVASLNRGLVAARGRYIARMDADDECLPYRFSRQLAFLKNGHCDLCGSWFIEFGQGIPRTVRWPHTEAEVRTAILFQNTICHPTVMARREIFEAFQYREDYRLAEDYDLFARASGTFHLANVPEPLLRYRRHPQQATQATRTAMEAVTCRIRVKALQAQGIDPTPEEQRLHNLVRAPSSIVQIEDLRSIEAWLVKIMDMQEEPGAKRVVASQWIRACIRAAPLGQAMWRAFRASPLYKASGAGAMAAVDLRILSICRLEYSSKPFSALRRFGLSA